MGIQWRNLWITTNVIHRWTASVRKWYNSRWSATNSCAGTIWQNRGVSSLSALALADAVERAAGGRTRKELQEASGIAARTLRDLLTGVGRRFGRATLDKLDEPLGWQPGHAWRLYSQPDDDPSTEERMVQLIEVQMQTMAERLASLESQPTWAGEVLDAFRPLTSEDRATILALARRLAASR